MLVGRTAETAALDRLLTSAEDGRSSILVVRGEAGVGKSALLAYVGERAEGWTVLRGAGIEAESGLTYAALHGLLRPALSRLDRLPDPQASALRAAFALSDETVDERFRVSLGVLGLLAEVAEERPLVCLVDDAQWLDQASADALLFAARRLEAESVVMVFAARADGRRPWAATGIPELHLSGLSAADARTLVAEQLGDHAPPDVVAWVVGHANGSPLALVELPAALSRAQRAGEAPVAGTVPPATSVEQVYLEQMALLPRATVHLLLLAAADEGGSRATVERAAQELGLDIDDLAPAEVAGLVRVDPEQIRFRHPLVRAAVYRDSPFTEREGAHRVLAGVAALEGQLDRAAWHRAAATVGQDEEVARELEQTAERARLRSGHAGAAAALERAADLSPDPVDRAWRLFAGATAAWRAGQPEQARHLVARAQRLDPDPHLQAELDNLRGVVEWRCGSLPLACDLLLAAAAHVAALDPATCVDMLADAALACWDGGDYARLADVGSAAGALPVADDDDHRLLAEVLTGAIGLGRGDDVDADRLRAALLDAVARDDQRLLIWAAIAAELAGERPLEVALLDRAASLARASGAVDRLTVVLESSTVQGFLAGDLTVAAEAAEALRLAREAGLSNAVNLHLATMAWVAAVTGHGDACRAYAAEVTEAARPQGHAIAASIAEWGLALLDLGSGRPGPAAARLRQLGSAHHGVAHPFYVLAATSDLVEACVRSDQPAAAAEAVAVLESGFGRATAVAYQALVARSRALVGDGPAAEADFVGALELHEAGLNPFDRARTQLLYGEYLRRERRRSDARDQLRSALLGFESLGARPWADRAGAELRATGETARRRDPSTLADLTPQELQIARLVSGGSANKEIAAQLFLSSRTVEYHLRKVFAKLGIASRSQLIKDGVPGDAATS